MRQRYETAQPDSARLVFGAILLGMGEIWATPEEVAEVIRSGSEGERALAIRELPRLFAAAAPVEPEIAAELTDRLLRMVIDGAAGWPALGPDAPRSARQPRPPADGDHPTFILADSLPAVLHGRWATRTTLIDVDTWKARSERLPAMLFRPRTVLRAGTFVQLAINYE